MLLSSCFLHESTASALALQVHMCMLWTREAHATRFTLLVASVAQTFRPALESACTQSPRFCGAAANWSLWQALHRDTDLPALEAV